MQHATVQNLYQKSSDFENNISTQGDSGGPLVVLKRDTNEERRCKFTWSLWVSLKEIKFLYVFQIATFWWGSCLMVTNAQNRWDF